MRIDRVDTLQLAIQILQMLNPHYNFEAGAKGEIVVTSKSSSSFLDVFNVLIYPKTWEHDGRELYGTSIEDRTFIYRLTYKK